MNKMRKVFDLRFAEGIAGNAALRRMSFLQERHEITAVTVAPHHIRTNQIRAFVRATRGRAVATDTLRRPDRTTTIRRRVVYEMFVIRARARKN